jgi:diguanylate cyclase (GGDEF)-like protein
MVTPAVYSLHTTLLLSQAVLLFLLLMAAFRVRAWFGLAPLGIMLGVAEGIKFFTPYEWQLYVPILEWLRPTSVVYFTAALAILLLVYIREDAAIARQIAVAMICANIGGAVLLVMVSLSASIGTNAEGVVAKTQLLRTAWRMFAGTSLLVVDVFLMMLLYNRLTRWAMPFILRGALVLGTVVMLDTFAYEAFVQGARADWSSAWTHAVGKVAIALVFTVMMWLYLRFAEEDTLSQFIAARTGRELFAVLTYRERFEYLRQAVIRDGLTGIFNRLYLDTRLPEQIALERRRQASVGVLMIDVDHFKRVNDTHGHAVGDEALKHLARIFTENVRRGDIVCRYGGEEFVVILPGATLQEATGVAQHLCAQVRAQPVKQADYSVPLSVTIGVAISPDDGYRAPEVLAAADKRLYQGKRSGRDQVVWQNATAAIA